MRYEYVFWERTGGPGQADLAPHGAVRDTHVEYSC